MSEWTSRRVDQNRFAVDGRAILTALLCLLLHTDVAAQTDAVPDSSVYIYRPDPVTVAAIDVPIHPAVAPSPDGRFFAVLQTRPDPILWIVPADTGAPFSYRKMWAAYKPRWAPSGNRIGFIAGLGPPRIWTIEVDRESGRPVDPPRMLYRAEANAYAFAPDGEWIAFVSRRSTARAASEIFLIEWESRNVRFLLRETGMIYRLDWAPDGQHIYYGVASESADSLHRVMRVRIRRASREIVTHVGEFLGLSPDGLSLLYRPDDFEAIRANAFEVSTVDGAPLLRVSVPRGMAPTWSAGSYALLQVRNNEAGDEIIAIPSPALWPFFFR